MTDQTARLAEVLAKHEPNGDAEWCTGDGCTYSFAEAAPENTGTYWEAFAHHLAESIAVAAEENAWGLEQIAMLNPNVNGSIETVLAAHLEHHGDEYDLSLSPSIRKLGTVVAVMMAPVIEQIRADAKQEAREEAAVEESQDL